MAGSQDTAKIKRDKKKEENKGGTSQKKEGLGEEKNLLGSII